MCIPCIYFFKNIIKKICEDTIPNISGNQCYSYCCIETKKLDELIEKYKIKQDKIKNIKIKKTITHLIDLLHEIEDRKAAGYNTDSNTDSTKTINSD